MWDSLDPRSHDTRERDPARPRARRIQIDPRDVFAQGLNLPRGSTASASTLTIATIALRGSEVRALATIGAFSVVPPDDLRDDRGRAGDVRHGDLERLREAGPDQNRRTARSRASARALSR